MKRVLTAELRRGRSGAYYWRILAGNGRVLCTSETYASKGNAQRGIDTLLAVQGIRLVDRTPEAR